MIRYGKTTQAAISAMSRLAEVYDDAQTRLSSTDIAEKRRLSRPLVAKLLTVLSRAGLVVGSTGPGGGYALGRPPKQITLFDIAEVFERTEDQLMCPFGPTWCGNGAPCPLHDQLTALNNRVVEFLQGTTLDVFTIDSVK
ncbi:MAG: RrF2 family transcriptional regulator [Phycisphaerales bacterium]